MWNRSASAQSTLGDFFLVWAGFPFCFFFRALSLLFSASMIDRKGAGAVERNLLDLRTYFRRLGENQQ